MFAPPGSSTVETHSADGMTYNPHPPHIETKTAGQAYFPVAYLTLIRFELTSKNPLIIS